MTNREELFKEAKELGLKFAKNAKTTAIQEAVDKLKMESVAEAAHKEVSPEPTIEGPTPEDAVELEGSIRAQLEKEFASKMMMEKAKMQANMEVNMASKNEEASENRVSVGQAKLKARNRATKLVRVNITCKDPMKSSWEGEIISAGNDVIGEVKKYVFFNTEDGYHLPQIIVNVLEEKKCTIFVNKKINNQMVKVAKSVKAYSLDYLEPLTEDELKALGSDQSARHSID